MHKHIPKAVYNTSPIIFMPVGMNIPAVDCHTPDITVAIDCTGDNNPIGKVKKWVLMVTHINKNKIST